MARGNSKGLSSSVRTEVLEDTLKATEAEIRNSPYDLKKAEDAINNSKFFRADEELSADYNDALKYGNPTQDWIDKALEIKSGSQYSAVSPIHESVFPMLLPTNHPQSQSDYLEKLKVLIQDYKNGEEPAPQTNETREQAIQRLEGRISKYIIPELEESKKQYKLLSENKEKIYDLMMKLSSWEFSSAGLKNSGVLRNIIDSIPDKLKNQFLPPKDIVALLYRGDSFKVSKPDADGYKSFLSPTIEGGEKTYNMKGRELSFSESWGVAIGFSHLRGKYKDSKTYYEDTDFEKNVVKGVDTRNVKYVFDPNRFKRWVSENFYNSGIPIEFFMSRGEAEYLVVGDRE
jgi:hypothetical protein